MGPLPPNIGKRLYGCSVELSRSNMFYIVVVTGEAPNQWGHSLLNIGGQGGLYVHVSGGVYKHPTIMTQHEYDVYRAYYKKTELHRNFVYLPHPEKSILLIEKLLLDQWFWRAAWHNCTTFIEQVLAEGGGYYNFKLNIPICGIPNRCF